MCASFSAFITDLQYIAARSGSQQPLTAFVSCNELYIGQNTVKILQLDLAKLMYHFHPLPLCIQPFKEPCSYLICLLMPFDPALN